MEFGTKKWFQILQARRNSPDAIESNKLYGYKGAYCEK